MASSHDISLYHLLILPTAWICWRLLCRQLFPTVLDNVPGPKPSSWFTGCLKDLTNTRAWEYHQKLEGTYGSTAQIKGIYGASNLYTFDPKALQHIFVKDLNIYEETDSFIEVTKLMFGGGILSTFGNEHRRQRKMLTPLFSNAHVREMVPTFYEVAHKVRRVFVQKAQLGPQEVDVLSWINRIALELIGQCGFGYSFDPLTENSVPHPYGVAFKQIIPLQAKSKDDVLMNFVIFPFLARVGTPRFRRWIIEHSESSEVKQYRDIMDTMYSASIEIFNAKKKAVEEGEETDDNQVREGKDVLSMLIKANIDASEEDKVPQKELLSQILTLTFAATDTTSSALSRTIHLLAQNKDVQDKLRQEISGARKNNAGQDPGYDELDSLPYLDAICKETLRLYPPFPILNRVNRQDSILPLRTPVRGINGQEIQEIPLSKGTVIHVSLLGSNRNPDFWGPDATEWNPDRWLNPLPNTLIDAHVPGIYSHLMTFLGGGRSCIGFKFSQLEMKVVIALLVESLEITLPSKPIHWQMTDIVTPNTQLESCNPTLPLIISLVK
ncbi:cytochrome P450 [Gymnopilus junonius]|uniref:Cytochrome P450 n=1 Tax=Gymnopilus junonius TaxID=109634 RepID=A0A9P5P061_GYMJU|nr:cytochrome P450 [Gymnopilus junonius]